jgi:hypothetical protein
MQTPEEGYPSSSPSHHLSMVIELFEASSQKVRPMEHKAKKFDEKKQKKDEKLKGTLAPFFSWSDEGRF